MEKDIGYDTVDGRNPVSNLVNNGDKLPTSTGAGFRPPTVSD